MKKRIENLVDSLSGLRLGLGKKILPGAIAIVAVAIPVTLRGQAQPPKFDVASIKLVKECRGGFPSVMPGRLQINCISTRALIRTSFGVEGMAVAARSINVVNGPSWLDTDLYEIAAKTDAKVTTADTVGPMLRALLEDRFRLSLHREPRETSVYELTVAGPKPNLQPMKEGDCTPIDLTNMTITAPKPGQAAPNYCGGSRGGAIGATTNVEFFGITMEELAGRMLSGYVGRPVVDKTGLTGRFNFRLEFVPQRPSGPALVNGLDVTLPEPAPDSGPTIFNALAKIGLKLSPAKSAVDVIVVDHVERPSEN